MPVQYDTNAENYQICSLLGECITNIGSVYVAKHLPSRNLVALKKYHVENVDPDDTTILVQEEIILMRQLNHENILPCYCAFVHGLDIISVLPLMGYGSCSNVITRHFPTGMPEAAISCILRGVLQGLIYLHSKAIIHRAVRASHILISADGNVKLSGLRYACHLLEFGKWQRKVHSFPSSTLPNLNWLSPELLQQDLEGYNQKCDVYSVGVTACELANGVVPFWDTETTLMLMEKVRGASPQLIDSTTFMHTGSADQVRDEISDDCMKVVAERRFTDSFHQVAERCMEKDPSIRPTALKLLDHSFFKQAPHFTCLPGLLLPAVPIRDTTFPEVHDDVEVLMVAEKLNKLEMSTVTWDF